MQELYFSGFSLKDVPLVLPLGPTTTPLLILFWVLLGADRQRQTSSWKPLALGT